MLPKELLATIHIVFLGSSKDGKQKEWLDTLIEKTIWKEFQGLSINSDISIKLFDVFVLSLSSLEGFPVVVIEAMSSGCCCI
ncbi:MAG: glycosyltransferase [Parabacteroides merdae]